MAEHVTTASIADESTPARSLTAEAAVATVVAIGEAARAETALTPAGVAPAAQALPLAFEHLSEQTRMATLRAVAGGCEQPEQLREAWQALEAAGVALAGPAPTALETFVVSRLLLCSAEADSAARAWLLAGEDAPAGHRLRLAARQAAEDRLMRWVEVLARVRRLQAGLPDALTLVRVEMHNPAHTQTDALGGV